MRVLGTIFIHFDPVGTQCFIYILEERSKVPGRKRHKGTVLMKVIGIQTKNDRKCTNFTP